MSKKLVSLILASACFTATGPVHAQTNASTRPEVWQTNLFLGNDLTQSGQYMAALRHYDLALKDNPNAWEVYLHKARVYEALKMPGHVIANYDLALEMNPRLAQAYLERAAYFQRMNKPPQELYDLSEGLRVLPQNADLYYARGNFYLKQENYALALADFQWATQFRPGMTRAYARIARCQFSLNNWPGYEFALGQLLNAGEKRPEVYFARSRVRNLLKNGLGAKADLDEVLKLTPNHSEALFVRGKMNLAQGMCQAALDDLKQACRLGQKEACYTKPPCEIPVETKPEEPTGVAANTGGIAANTAVPTQP